MLAVNGNKMEIIANQSVNPLRSNLKDVSINDIRLCQSSGCYRLEGSNGREPQRILKYQIAFHMDNQGGRYKLDEYSFCYSDSVRDLYSSNKEALIKLTGIREIIASGEEGKKSKHLYFQLLPLYGFYGKSLMGTQILKKKS